MVAVHTDKNELLLSLVIEFHLLSMPASLLHSLDQSCYLLLPNQHC